MWLGKKWLSFCMGKVVIAEKFLVIPDVDIAKLLQIRTIMRLDNQNEVMNY